MKLMKIENTSKRDFDVFAIMCNMTDEESKVSWEYKNPTKLPKMEDTINYMYDIMCLFFGVIDINTVPDDIIEVYHLHLTEGFISLNKGELEFTNFYNNINEPKIKSFWGFMARKERHRKLNFLIYLNDKLLKKHNDLNLSKKDKMEHILKLDKFIKDSVVKQNKQNESFDSTIDIYDHLLEEL